MPALHVALVETAPPDQKGSMTRYGEQVWRALGQARGNTLRVERIHLGLPHAVARLAPARLRPWAHHAWISLASARRLRDTTADVVHILDGSHAYVAGWLSGGRIVATAHDVIPLLQCLGKLRGPRLSWMGRRVIWSALARLRQLDRIVADSGRTAADLREIGGIAEGRVVVVSPAVAPWPAADVEPRDPAAPEAAPYVLHVGNDAFYKNRLGVVRVFARVRSGAAVRLKMVGPQPGAELRRLAATLGVLDHVEFLTDAEDEQLAALYRRARLLLFPSLYEGFGWPPLEAMAAGCPVVCSDAASLPEVVGDAALTCPAEDEATLATHALRLLQDPALAASFAARGRVQAARFSLDRLAQGLLAAYETALDAPRERAAAS